MSDKFGDIFRYAISAANWTRSHGCLSSYPLHPKSEVVPDASRAEDADAETVARRSQIVSHENPSDGTLILGHTSLLTSFLLAEDEKYIISADRDEHIRVSWYPQGYVIERFCLGHKK